jgi:hypothetical protein
MISNVKTHNQPLEPARFQRDRGFGFHPNKKRPYILRFANLISAAESAPRSFGQASHKFTAEIVCLWNSFLPHLEGEFWIHQRLETLCLPTV